MHQTANAPHYFVFSEFPREALEYIGLSKGMATLIDVNPEDRGAYADFMAHDTLQAFYERE